MTGSRTSLLATTAAALALGVVQPAPAHGNADLARLGKVTFPVSCDAEAQKEFEISVALYHSFAWPELQASLDRVLKADPNCAMAHWGRAIGALDNPFTWPGAVTPKVLADGQEAVAAARAAGAKTQRERDYIEAIAAYYQDADKRDHRARAQSLENAMREVAERYPQDTEATVLYSLVLSANFDPTDKEYKNQLRAAALLEPIFAKHPDHPGTSHYLIHSYDYPPIAQKGLEAARRYASIAPDATHALHMPSHIFTRVGYWKESVAANRQSAKVDADKTMNSVHAYDYMVYAHLQLGQDKAAREVIAHAGSIATKPDHVAAAYAYAAMPARLVLERGAWAEAAKLPLTPSAGDYPWAKYPMAEAINAFARGVGAGMIGDAAGAHAEIARLQALRERATSMRIAYWAEQIAIQADVVGGLATCAEGKNDACITMLRAAAAREDATEKHAVTPGPILPAREVLATILLERGGTADALREFEAVLAKEPNRYRAYAGALMAAEKTGAAQKLSMYANRVIEQTAAADSPLPELVAAKRALGR